MHATSGSGRRSSSRRPGPRGRRRWSPFAATVAAALLCVAPAPAQQRPGAPPAIGADVVADLARFDACAPQRREALAALVRAAFALPDDVVVRVRNCAVMPGGDRPRPAATVQVEVEAALAAAPQLCVRLLGSLDATTPMRIGFGAKGWNAHESARERAAAMLASARRLLGGGGAADLRFEAIVGTADSRDLKARHRVSLPVGATRVEASIDLPLGDGDAAELRGAVGDLRAALLPLAPRVDEATAWSAHVRAGRRGREITCALHDLAFHAAVVDSDPTWRVAEQEIAPTALAALLDAARRQRALGAKVWSGSRALQARVVDRGFLLVRCPARAPEPLPADGAGDWLEANAQAVLLVERRDAAGRVASLEPRPLELRVHDARWPAPFAIEVADLGARIVWANPSQPAVIEGAGLQPF